MNEISGVRHQVKISLEDNFGNAIYVSVFYLYFDRETTPPLVIRDGVVECARGLLAYIADDFKAAIP
jgi:hypothetical protein